MSNGKKTSPKRTSGADQTTGELSVNQLSKPCDPESLSFSTTSDLPGLPGVIGQPRAFRALELGSEVDGIGYNIFVLGIPDSGRTTLTRNYLRQKAAQEPVPDDWCLVNNFADPRRPHALRMPAGQAVRLRKEMRDLITECKQKIPRVFSVDEYTRERERLVESTNEKVAQELSQLEEYVQRYSFVIIKTPYGLFLGPAAGGKPLGPDELEKLTDEQREKLQKLQEKLSERVEKTLARMREIEQSTNEELSNLDTRTAHFVIQPLISALQSKYADNRPVLDYFERVQADLIQNVNRFRMQAKAEQNPLEEKEWAVRYEINVLVDRSDQSGAPVIIENQPSYHNLLGSIEHDVILGVSYTNFAKIRPGALHRANNGYLILPARDVLINPYAWEGLKRVLRDGEIRIIELTSQMGLVSSATLEPDPIPLEVKVLLVGTPLLYYLLRAYDEDFAKLFKVRAEFATEMERSPESEGEYALFVRSVIDENRLPPFDRTAVARIIEHSARMVENQDKLSTQFGIIKDLVCEAAYWARKNGREPVDSSAVQRALDERVFRSNLIEERIQELIRSDQLVVSVDGAEVGQINALSVSSLGDYAFGRPNRVTASVGSGDAGVIDIERQARLGGPIHTKGVLIIGGFIRMCYGQTRPINLSAGLTFEQSYDEIDGDSASAAELIALLSAISGIPIDQSRAITGSVNQHGRIQAIGGVNEKIEGFFETCRQKGLTGRQGVIIPDANRRNLMLKEEVRAAVAAGKFHIWTVATIADAVLLLTGREFGGLQSDGAYPEGTFNRAVVAALESYAEIVHRTVAQKRRRGKPAPGDAPSNEADR